jgi:TIR domain
MAYLPQYEYDIFVSYAHVDDDPLPGANEGWVSTLVRSLKTRLAQKLGRSDAYSLWMDHELFGSEPVSSQILGKLHRAAMLVVVLSPGYVASAWCRRERDAFLRVVREHGSGRVFVVERDMVDDTDRPAEFKDLKGFRFWVRDRAGKARILGTPRPNPDNPTDQEYYNQIDDLSQEITTVLRHLKANACSGLAEVPAPAACRPFQPTVYLAQVTDDLEVERNNIKRYLDQTGARVLPETWSSQEPSAFRQAAERDLAHSELFVQLLSGTPGKKPVDLPQGYPKYQLELATVAGKPILQWRSPTLDVAAVEDEAHRAVLEAATVQAEGLEDFKQEIRRRLFERPQPPTQPRPNAFVFVNMESADRPLAEEVCDILDRSGAEYALPIQSSDPAENRRDLEQNLAECDALIVVYGATTVTWVRRQLIETRKALASRQRPLRALGVFEGPPDPKDRLDMKFQNMRILNCRKGVSEAELKRFLDSVAAEVAQ